MEVNKPQPEPHIIIERDIINLMLKFDDIICDIVEHTINPDLFDPIHKTVVESIIDVYNNSRPRALLTAETYKDWLIRKGMGGDTLKYLNIFDKCLLRKNNDKGNFYHLKKQFLDYYAQRRSAHCAQTFKEDIGKYGHYEAVEKFTKNLEKIIHAPGTGELDFAFLDSTKDQYVSLLENQKNNPEDIIRCHIPEIDDAVAAGFRSQHFTLFVGDVGSGKTNIMLNIALNMYDKHNVNILFVPLEMNKMDLINRIIANRTGIDLSHLTKPQFLSDEEEKVVRESKVWDSMQNRFAILDAKEITTVGTIEREIEKRLYTFKPQVIIIDYIANLKPEREHGGRNDLEIGEILKTLRFLGNKHGFHIISAAQMGRKMITQLREEGSNATPDSTGIRGSHEYSADSDNIFCLLKRPDQPDTLKVFVLKSRHGKAGQTFELRVDHAKARINSTREVDILSGDCGDDDNFGSFEKESNTDPKDIMKEISKTHDDIFGGISLDDDIDSIEDDDGDDIGI